MNCILKIYFILSIIFLFSCNNTRIVKDLDQFYSNSINFPLNSKITYNGTDSIMGEYYNSEYKLVVFYDSLGCKSCNINKLYLWDAILEYARKSDDKLKLYFIFCPKKSEVNLLYFTLKNNPINYPVLIDEKGDFERLNPHLPKNKALHTFLLDENNKVILVGNPLYNKEIEKLFYKTTQELLSK